MSEYFKLTMNIIINANNEILAQSYHTRIFPCVFPDDSNEFFKIFTDSSVFLILIKTLGIRFELSDGISTFYSFSNYWSPSGIAMKPSFKSDFNFRNLEVKSISVNQGIIFLF